VILVSNVIAMLGLRRRGHRPYEVAVTGMLSVILVGFLVDALLAGVHPPAILSGTIPSLQGTDTLLLAVGMLGATVMHWGRCSALAPRCCSRSVSWPPASRR